MHYLVMDYVPGPSLHAVLEVLRRSEEPPPLGMCLTVFIDDPRIPLDNNLAERLMRNPAVGRKNYYGSGAEWAGRLATMMFSILATLKLWKINPRLWLTWYLESCAAGGGKTPALVNSCLNAKAFTRPRVFIANADNPPRDQLAELSQFCVSRLS